MVGEFVTGLKPRLAGQHIRYLDVTRLYHPGLGVENAVPLLLDVGQLGLQGE